MLAVGGDMPDERPQRWHWPAPLGYGEAINQVTTVAAPLLAGFALTFIGLVLSASVRWPGLSLLVLTLAASALVASLQFGFHARRHLYSAEDLHAWVQTDASTAEVTRYWQGVQERDLAYWRRWSHRARWTYNGGIVLLAAGVALALAPPNSVGGIDAVFRWSAAGIAALAAGSEGIWWWSSRRATQ